MILKLLKIIINGPRMVKIILKIKKNILRVSILEFVRLKTRSHQCLLES